MIANLQLESQSSVGVNYLMSSGLSYFEVTIEAEKSLILRQRRHQRWVIRRY